MLLTKCAVTAESRHLKQSFIPLLPPRVKKKEGEKRKERGREFFFSMAQRK
jgi:hypothetical protein